MRRHPLTLLTHTCTHTHTEHLATALVFARAERSCLREPASAIFISNRLTTFLYTTPTPRAGVSPLACRIEVSARLEWSRGGPRWSATGASGMLAKFYPSTLWWCIKGRMAVALR